MESTQYEKIKSMKNLFTFDEFLKECSSKDDTKSVEDQRSLTSSIPLRVDEASQIYHLWVLLPRDKNFRKLTVTTHSLEALKKDAAAYAEDLIQNLPDRGRYPMNLQPQSLAIATDDDEVVWVDYPYTESQLKRNPRLKDAVDAALALSGLKIN